MHAEARVLHEVWVGEQRCPLALGVLLLQSCHVRVGGLLQVVELVLEDHARVVKSVGDDGVALSHLLLRERNLRQIILALVRIVLRTVCHERQRVGCGFCLRY